MPPTTPLPSPSSSLSPLLPYSLPNISKYTPSLELVDIFCPFNLTDSEERSSLFKVVSPNPYSRSPQTVTVAIYHSEMSYQDQSGYPPPREQESQYPPPPGEEDDRARGAYHQRGASSGGSVNLPSISSYDHYGAPPPNGYPADPRGYQQDPYRAPPGQYRDDRGYPQDYGRGGAQNMAFTQSAPRQRTAIACRYCRRRKVSL